MRLARMDNAMAMAACLLPFVAAQDQAQTCYGPGSIVGAVVGTLIVTLVLLVSSFFLYKIFWKIRKGKHLVLMADAEIPQDQYAFDNPCFREATPIKHSFQDEKPTLKLEKSNWPGWPSIHTLSMEQRVAKITSMDDTCINDSRLKIVNLKGHDFTGLGFNICGNMRDGIFVKDVLHRGPAFESGCINTGDRIDSVCINFRNMVFEDALTILSYASPYDVQVQVENESYSRPSTLMRSKRESKALNFCDKILHPKFSRSQSICHINEIGKSNKKLNHQMGFTLERNRINHSLNKSQDFSDYRSIKVSSSSSEGKTLKNVTPKISPLVGSKKSSKAESPSGEFESQQTKQADSQNKLQKFGIKVLPMNLNPKMGVQSMTGAKKLSKSSTSVDKELNSSKEKPEKFAKPIEQPLITHPMENHAAADEPDSSKENVKAILAKGFLNLKEKINQNAIGKKKKGVCEGNADLEHGNQLEGEDKLENEGDCPVPKLRSSVACGVKAYEQSQHNHVNVPEEVSRAGDVARNNRKSLVEARKSVTNLEFEVVQVNKMEPASDSDGSSDKESVKDETKRPKRSKGKAPSPPKQATICKEIDEIKKEYEITEEESIFEPNIKTISLKDEGGTEKNTQPSYDSDSDMDPTSTAKDIQNTKIELNATQVTIHHSPLGDANDDEMEPSRKAASLGDLSKLDSDQPLSVVLERAVSLDLTEGTSQCGKKRKAPLPPSEEFPMVFDDLSYRKEPRLEELNTFQRRLKKSSDFGTLEDALDEGPKSLEIEVNKILPNDLTETYNNNIQEFSSWLAECRKSKAADEDTKSNNDKSEMNSTSFININSSDSKGKNEKSLGKLDYQERNLSFNVSRKNHINFETCSSPENFPDTNSRTVVVISQPNSLETTLLEKSPLCGKVAEEAKNGKNQAVLGSGTPDDEMMPPKLPMSPIPPPSTLSSPLSSTLTYITEIKVSTSEHKSQKLEDEIPSSNLNSDRIQRLDSSKELARPPAKNHFTECSKIPIRTMKSETGQKVLATIHSLSKEVSSNKTPEVEYAKRMASLFSNPQKSDSKTRNNEKIESEILRPNVSGLYLKTPLPKPSKDYSPTRKIPPVVPPRKMETSLTSKSTVAMELPLATSELHERNLVTFSSFVGSNRNEDSDTPSGTSFEIKEHDEINGREERVKPMKTSATKIVFERDEVKDDF